MPVGWAQTRLVVGDKVRLSTAIKEDSSGHVRAGLE